MGILVFLFPEKPIPNPKEEENQDDQDQDMPSHETAKHNILLCSFRFIEHITTFFDGTELLSQETSLGQEDRVKFNVRLRRRESLREALNLSWSMNNKLS